MLIHQTLLKNGDNCNLCENLPVAMVHDQLESLFFTPKLFQLWTDISCTFILLDNKITFD
jgi:hypothetical protein